MNHIQLSVDHRLTLHELSLLRQRLGHEPITSANIGHTLPDDLAHELQNLLRLPELGVVGYAPANFKAFGPKTPPQPLAPITLIFGPNSSGKSSLLHSLLWSHHAATTGELDVVRPEISGNNVNLGGFKTFRHKRSANSVSLAFDLLLPRRYALDSSLTQGRLSLDYSLEGTEPETVPVLRTLTLEARGEELVRASRRPNNRLQVDRMPSVPGMSAGIFAPVTGNLQAAFAQTSEELFERFSFNGDGLLPTSSNRLQISPNTANPEIKERAEGFVQHIEALILDACAIVRDWLDLIVYLGPIRTYPDRTWSFSDYQDSNWKAGGGGAWEAIRDIKHVRDYVNRFIISTGYAFRTKDYLSEKDASEAVENYLNAKPAEDTYTETEKPEIAGDLDEAERFDFDRFSSNRPARLRDLVLYDVRNRIEVSARDVGVGISQLVPVVATAYGLSGRTILIEQPEIHVHPKLQADLGDVFIESSLREPLMRNHYLIETHSETLILRVLRRIRETKLGKVNPSYAVTAADVAIYYVEPTKDGSILRRIRIDNTGRMIDRVPGGFFEDNFSEMFS